MTIDTGTKLDLDAIEARANLAAVTRHVWAKEIGVRDVNVIAGLRQAKELAVDDVPALVAEVRRLRAQVADLTNRLHHADQEIDSHAKAVTAWANETAAKDKVIDAAKAWGEAVMGPVQPLVESEALYRALQDLPNDQEPCDICAGNGCPDCREDEPIDQQPAATTGAACQYGYPLGGVQPRVDWCRLRAGHAGLHKGDDHPIGFTDAGTVKRTAEVTR